MKSTLLVLIAAATLSAAAANAETILVNYTGTVANDANLSTTANTGFAAGATISGSFLLDSVTDVVSGSTLGGFSAPAGTGYAPLASISLDHSTALYEQGLFAGAGDSRNSSITVNLQATALTGFTVSDPAALLLQLAGQADFNGATDYPFSSTAIYYDATASGTNITSLSVYINSVSAQVVPLPASVWLFGGGLLGLGVFGASRRRAA